MRHDDIDNALSPLYIKTMHYAFTEETINEVLAYLGTRPFNEVSELFNKIKAGATPVSINQPVIEPTTPEIPVESQNLTPEPTTEGGINNVQSKSSESETETTSPETQGEEGDGQKTESSNQG